MRVIATAGHVDHGKSTLVRALTGINPDRLKEEQRREMTIDLGFAWMALPGSGEAVGIIDVPGHIDFIDNMLAGVGGIDMALLVIAADEGPMPQTREHLAILELLKAERALVALTKCDLVDDEWIALMRAEITQLLADTPLAGAPVIPVSARSGTGLDELQRALGAVLEAAPPRRDLGRPRLPIDRVFTLQGIGTVVTGTLIDGALRIGDMVEVLTTQGAVIESHVRGLQTHKQKLETALAGSRVAVNLAGVSVEQAARGGVVARPGMLLPSTLLDVRLEMLSAARLKTSVSLRHNAEVKVFSGAAMSLARVWLLDADELQPGAAGWAQLLLSTPLAVRAGDRFVVRVPSPSVTAGGGVIVDAHPALRYRRRGGSADASVLERLLTLSAGTPAERLSNALAELRFATRAEAIGKTQLDTESFAQALGEVLASGEVAESANVLALSRQWQADADAAVKLLAAHHARLPLLEGMSKASLRSQLGRAPRDFDALLQSAAVRGVLADDGETVRAASHAVRFTPQQQRAVDELKRALAAQPWNTPLVKDCKAACGDAVYEVLIRRRELMQLNADVVLLAPTYDDAVQRVREAIKKGGPITAAQVRDLFATTRKYALALLEHLDAAGVTRRDGDARVLRE